MKEICLSDLEMGNICRIKKVNSDSLIKRRLLDLGLTNGTVVESAFKNYGGSLTAYLIRGSLIALRKDDTKNIIVEVL